MPSASTVDAPPGSGAFAFRILRGGIASDKKKPAAPDVLKVILRIYEFAVRRALRYAWLMLPACVVILVAGIFIAGIWNPAFFRNLTRAVSS